MVHTFAIEPQTYIAFENEAEQLDKCKEWGLLSDKATKSKAFYYKGNGKNEACSIVGYVDRFVAVIEFDNKQKHCIHPSYLKEMQASSYGQKYAARAESEDLQEQAEAEPELHAVQEEPELTVAEEAPPTKELPAAEEPAKAKAPKTKGKVQLPEEKVKMTATVKEFATVPNHFSDNDDEVVIYEAVAILDSETVLGEAWSSHSATIKKLELAIGDTITFEGKVVAKKLTKHPVPYKINNPAKIQKDV
ncbi:hypothetical protein ACFPVX_14925 [Cohnella faecalis]|uniref:Uncharacterized protein n=1 Tax=Cohnella faecalis TaxID=2315694 RepID=A0A398CPE9_9BACL|nr:hypothetical protein [Cohnella faecalis]RIE01787.1 hypothetical protein D3H35_13375 [Cohnella faecalis]